MVNLLVAAALAAASPTRRRRRCPPTPTRRCSWSATPTPPSTSSAPSTRSTASPNGSTTRSRTPSSSPTSWCSKRLFPKTPGSRSPLRQPVRDCRSVTPSASFLATTRMAINAGRAQGMQVDNGADMVLRHAGRSRRQAGRGARDASSCSSTCSAACRRPRPRRAAGRRRRSTPSSMDSLSKAMAEMQSAWKRGDQSVFVRMLGQLEQASPDTYRMMFTERNARWADWIAARHADARERCSSRSAPAISRARTACSSGSPSAASRRTRVN